MFPLCSGYRLFHPVLDALVGPDRDVRLHAALPESVVPVDARGVYGPSDAVFVVPHVAISHCYRFNVGVNERLIPRHCVGHAVDVIPPAGVVADEVPAESGAYFHELEGGLDLLDQDVDLYGAYLDAEMVFEGGKELVPECRLFSRLYLRQIEDYGRARRLKLLVVVYYVEDRIDYRGGKGYAVLVPYMPVVEVKPACAEDLGREIELLSPVGYYFAPEKALGPFVHFARDLLCRIHEYRVFSDCQLEVPLVVEGHGADLPEGVFAIEHPAVRSGEKSVSHVTYALVHAGVWPRSRAGPLYPLSLEIVGDVRAYELAVSGVLYLNICARNEVVGVEKADAFSVAEPLSPSGVSLFH